MPSMKRSAAAAVAGGVVKAPKRAAPKGPYAQVMKGLAASDLPATARELLTDMAMFSLEIPKENRDKYQSRVVQMAEEALLSTKKAMEEASQEVGSLMAEDAKQKEELDNKSAAKGSMIETKHGEVVAKKQELAQLARSFRAARGAAQEAGLKALSIDAEATVKAQEREMLTSLRAGLEGLFEDGKAEDLVKKLTDMGTSESMMVALPAVLVKDAAQRGAFDTMVLTSVQAELDSRIAAADEAIQNVGPAKALAAEVLSSAEAALKQANTQQVAGAAAYQKVHGEEEELSREAEELKAAFRKLREATRKHNSMNSKAKVVLDVFQTGPKQAFEELRDKVAAAPGIDGAGATAAEGAVAGAAADEGAAGEGAAGDMMGGAMPEEGVANAA